MCVHVRFGRGRDVMELVGWGGVRCRAVKLHGLGRRAFSCSLWKAACRNTAFLEVDRCPTLCSRQYSAVIRQCSRCLPRNSEAQPSLLPHRRHVFQGANSINWVQHFALSHYAACCCCIALSVAHSDYARN